MRPLQIGKILERAVSAETERAVLAAALLEQSLLPEVRAQLRVDDFGVERHQLLFAAFEAIADEGAVVDVRTVQAHLELRDQFELAGGIAYLAGLDVDLPDISALAHYVQIVKDLAVRRDSVRAMARSIVDLGKGKASTSEVLHASESCLKGLMGRTVRTRPTGVGELVERFHDDLEEGGASLQGIPTGFADLDNLGGGLLEGKLIVYAGRPGMGKTTFLLNVLHNLGLIRVPSAMFSLEMDAQKELTPKLICLHGDINESGLRRGWLSQKQWERFAVASREVSEMPLWLESPGRLSLRELEAACRLMKAEHDVRVVAVDYLQLMGEDSRRYDHRRYELAAITRGSKQLARELGISLILLSQLSRDSEKRGGDYRPRLSDLAESGATEQDADQVTFLHRPEVYDPATEHRGICELLNRKNRGGATGDRQVGCDLTTGRFSNLEHQPQAGGAEEDPF